MWSNLAIFFFIFNALCALFKKYLPCPNSDLAISTRHFVLSFTSGSTIYIKFLALYIFQLICKVTIAISQVSIYVYLFLNSILIHLTIHQPLPYCSTILITCILVGLGVQLLMYFNFILILFRLFLDSSNLTTLCCGVTFSLLSLAPFWNFQKQRNIDNLMHWV